METPPGEQPLFSHKERQERIYQDIERKIALGKKLWRFSKALVPPSANDSQEVVEQQEGGFRGVLQEAFDAYPQATKQLAKVNEARKKLDQYELENARRRGSLIGDKKNLLLEPEDFELETDPQSTTENSDKVAALHEIINSAGNDPDVRFLQVLERGVNTAIRKRQDIREILSQGREGTVSEAKMFFSKSTDLSPQLIERFGRYTFRVHNFSISIFIPQKDIILYIPGYRQRRFGGRHVSDSCWNILLQESSLDEAILGRLPEDHPISQSRKAHSLHEDNHSFFEGFSGLQETSSLSDSLSSTIRRYLSMKDIGVPSWSLSGCLTTIEHIITKLMDADVHELVANIASRETRDKRIVGSTFGAGLIRKQKIITELEGHPDGDIRLLSTRLKKSNPKLYDPQKLSGEILELYQVIQDKAPEKTEDLDIAFVLFPPSQIGIVRKLVKRWIGQDSAF